MADTNMLRDYIDKIEGFATLLNVDRAVGARPTAPASPSADQTADKNRHRCGRRARGCTNTSMSRTARRGFS
jgi:hypothetical protein